MKNSFLPFYIFASFIFCLFIAWLLARKQLFQNAVFGIITYTCFFFLGTVSYQVRLPEFQEDHYSHSISTNSENNLFQLKIKEVLKTDTYNHKYIAEINSINQLKTKGKILLNIKKDSLNSPLIIDAVLLISSTLHLINSPLNPHQFDYSKYMKTLGVYHQSRITNIDILHKFEGKSTLRGTAEKARNLIINKLKESPITPDELSIIQALILGQRKDISKEMFSEYAAAGAIHILAVSGLHVGIVFFILQFLFSPFKYFKKGKIIIPIMIVICLWGFAFITGLSPSVLRAVTMFSFFAFAKMINRDTNSINTMFLSYFVLLLVNPMWLFHVGFQLSYLAVFFILWILPMLNRMYYPTNYFLKKGWGILTVTIAAQIGIIPLSLFYFHQFPGLFFLTNIVILPFLGIVLGFGIFVITLALLNALPDWIAIAYNYIIKGLNWFVNWIANQESFLIQDIHFSSEKAIFSYVFIIFTLLIWKNKKPKYILYSLASLVILIGIFIFDNYSNAENQLIIFQKSRQTLIGYKNGSKLQLFKSDTSKNYKESYPLKGYRVANGIDDYSEKKLPQVVSYNDKNILILDSLGVYPKNRNIDMVLLSLSPKVNLERLIDSLQPKLIIADGNNYTSYVKRWQQTCKEKKLPFHYTGKEGAYVFKLQK
ncbi:MAG: ComEC family competence protein [Flavobacteriaceae bacterium]|nr:ComEC family competence protein [Flavobacteriaceae bacterium]